MRLGDATGADGVVLHPGSQAGEPLEECLPRIGDALRHALSESDRCPLLLENTAGMTGTIGRSFEELADLIDRAGGDRAHRRVPRLLPPARERLRHPHHRRAERGRGRLRPRARARPVALPARERLEGPARREPRPPRGPARRVSSGARAWARSSPSRASRAYPRCSRWPGRTAADPTRIRSGSPASSAPKASRRGRRERLEPVPQVEGVVGRLGGRWLEEARVHAVERLADDRGTHARRPTGTPRSASPSS